MIRSSCVGGCKGFVGLVLYMSLSDIHDDGRGDGLHDFTTVANMGQDRQGLQVTFVDGVESGW